MFTNDFRAAGHPLSTEIRKSSALGTDQAFSSPAATKGLRWVSDGWNHEKSVDGNPPFVLALIGADLK